MLGALGVFAIEIDAEHLHVEMGAGQNRGTAIRRLDGVDIGADIPEHRMGDPVGQLKRRAGGSRRPDRSEQNDGGDRDESKDPGAAEQAPLARTAVVFGHGFSPDQITAIPAKNRPALLKIVISVLWFKENIVTIAVWAGLDNWSGA